MCPPGEGMTNAGRTESSAPTKNNVTAAFVGGGVLDAPAGEYGLPRGGAGCEVSADDRRHFGEIPPGGRLGETQLAAAICSADDRAREIFTARSSIFKVRFSYGA